MCDHQGTVATDAAATGHTARSRKILGECDMTLVDQAKTVCDRLAPLGWRDTFLRVTDGTLDISQRDSAALRDELLKPLAVVKRSTAGFTDFSLDGNRGITPRSPASSLLYHALASPGVTEGVDDFPTLKELDIIENLVFGIEPLSIDSLATEAALSTGDRFVVAVFWV